MILVEKIKILGMSDPLQIASGYANQARQLFSRLALNPDFEVVYLGWNLKSHIPNFKGGYYNPQTKSMQSFHSEGCIRVLEDFGNCQKHDFGTEALKHYLKQEQPDILWILGDSFFLGPQSHNNNVFSDFHKLDLAPAKFVLYFPSDGRLLPNNSPPVFSKAHTIVGMSQFAQNDIITGTKPLPRPLDAHYIPHGINTNVFYPFTDAQKITNRSKWEQRLSQVNGRPVQLNGKFVFGSVMRNQPRKMPQDMLLIWKEFVKDKQDVVLLLHTDPFDPQGMNLIEIINYFQIPNVIFTGMNLTLGQFSESDLNEIYNLMDCHILTTTGEGFGIPTVEAQAAGVPSILTDYTTTKELVVDPECGLGVKVYQEMLGQCYVMRAMIDQKEFVNKMSMVYSDRNLLRKLASNCRQNAVSKYDMDRIVYPQWTKLFKELME